MEMTDSEQNQRYRVNKIMAMRQVLLEELQLIQDSCIHKDYQIGQYSWRPGVHELYKICEICAKPFSPAFPPPAGDDIIITSSPL